MKAYNKYCGAVAISFSHVDIQLIESKIHPFIRQKIKTNIHFLLTQNSINEAIDFLSGKWDTHLKGLNAVVFLTYKSQGRAKKEGILQPNYLLKKFLQLLNEKKSKLDFGFDACFVPMLLKYTNTDNRLLDSCECGFFSAYIDERLNVKPCSFTPNQKFSYSLMENDFEQIWIDKFKDYRLKIKNNCELDCSHKLDCRGGCLFYPYLNICQDDNL